MRDDIKWGTKVDVKTLDGEPIITGFFLEYDEGTDLYWVNSEGNDYAYDAADHNLHKVNGEATLITTGFEQIDKLLKNGIPKNLMYSVSGRVWRPVPRNISQFNKDWRFIEVKQ